MNRTNTLPSSDSGTELRLPSNPNIYADKTTVGTGVFATRDLPPTSWILTVEGPTLSGEHPVTDLDEQGILLQTGVNEYITPKPPASLLNHSCEPNAGFVKDQHLVAIRPISAGDEIRFDYSTTMDEDNWTLDCQCEAPSCRGIIGDFADLPEDRRQEYLDLGIVPSFIARQYRSGI